ncbi:MAG: ABC transporter substrate-binding protein [Candidatus Kapaibacterium sp.]
MFLGALLCLCVTACKQRVQLDTTSLRPARGGVVYGGVYRVNENGDLRSMDPAGVNDVSSSHITSQIYDQLMDFDDSLNLTFELAERREISADGRVYTYVLRRGVRFHDDPCFPGGQGRELTASDVVYSYTRLCDARTKTLSSEFFRGKVIGAEEYFAATRDAATTGSLAVRGIKGYSAPDRYTFRIELEKPFGPFEYMVALNSTGIVPREAVEYYKEDFFKHPVGSGPFRFHHWTPDIECVLVRNPGYWAKDEWGNTLPYLDGVVTSFIKDDKIQLLEFREGNLEESYRIPTEFFPSIVDEHKRLRPAFSGFTLNRATALSSQYYGMLTVSDAFKDPRVRKAFNHAVDRARIIAFVLKGQAAAPAIHGLVPPTMPGYESDKVIGYDYDVAKARAYLAEAGYPGGKGFPTVTLQLNAGGGRNTLIAEAVQTMLIENLGVDCRLKIVEFAKHLDAIDHGKAEFFRLGWIADYPDPESFLSLFYGKVVPASFDIPSPQNGSRYRNPAFDAMFEKARSTPDRNERNALFRQAEQLAMNDAPFRLTFYDEDYRLVQPYVVGLRNNAMDRRAYKGVWFNPSRVQ